MGTAGLGLSPDGDVELSQTTLRLRDEERQGLIEEARRAAQKLIVSPRGTLDEDVDELRESEGPDRAAVDRSRRGVPRFERAPGLGLRVVVAATALDAAP